MEPKNCPTCGDAVTPRIIYIWHVTCDNCYDGAPDAGPQLQGFSDRMSDALASWNEQVEEYEAEAVDEAAADLASEADRDALDRECDRQEEAGIDRWRGLE